MTWQVPLFDLDLGPEEHEAVQRVLDSGWLTMGEEVRAFEREFADFTGAPHAVAVANCTAGLHLALKALDIGPGHEVICPSLNFCAGPNVITALGATPVFADITSADDLCLSPDNAAARITDQTRAIMVMHYAGFPCDMAAFASLADKHGLALIEDAAHAPGATLDGRPCGASWNERGHAACFSFYSNKNLTTGEGGMVATTDPDLARRLELLRSHGMTASTLDRHKGHAFSYDVAEPGFNYRLDEMRAALGRVQLRRLPGFNAARKDLAAHYRENLKDVKNLTLPFAAPRGEPAHHIMPVLLNPGVDRQDFMEALKARSIQTSIHYPPVHLFGWYRENHPGRGLPLTEDAASRLVTLPLYATMGTHRVDMVCAAIREYFNQREAA